MRSLWTALTMVLVLAGLTPLTVHAQGGPPQPPPRRTGPVIGLNQNYPNPMNPETSIPFAIDPQCAEPGRKYSVSLTIYNILAQPIAIPVLQRQGTMEVVGGQKLAKLQLGCGEYTAYWDGKYTDGREASSGVYIYILEVDGHRVRKQMQVVK